MFAKLGETNVARFYNLYEKAEQLFLKLSTIGINFEVVEQGHIDFWEIYSFTESFFDNHIAKVSRLVKRFLESL